MLTNIDDDSWQRHQEAKIVRFLSGKQEVDTPKLSKQ